MRDVIHGSRAVAEAVKLCKPKVVAAYPITPQTHIVEDIAKMIADGELKAEYVKVESEHSAMSACIGAAATGVRTFTSTSSQGLALMHEVVFIASGLRLPIVMAVANRALSAPINIWNDQQDTMSERDAGWIQLFCETNQDAFDLTVQAYKIAEDKDVYLPVMVNMDGFVLTHTVEPVEIADQELVDRFLPEYRPVLYFDPEDVIIQGAFADPSTYTEFRAAQQAAMDNALKVIEKAGKDFGKLTGREFDLIKEYNTDGAEIIIVTLGSVAGTIKDVVDRHDGVGVVAITSYRPFPKEKIIKALKNARVVAVVEKDVSVGMNEGALYTELKSVLYNLDIHPRLLGFIVGLGGRDVTPRNIEGIIESAKEALKKGIKQEVQWVGLR